MPSLRDQLERCFRQRVCLMGVGNLAYGDGGFGIRLAEALIEMRQPPAASSPDDRFPPRKRQALRIVIAGTVPERFIGQVMQAGCDHLIFLDAVEFGAAPGSVAFLDAAAAIARFPQISTHKISLGTLAKYVESSGPAKAWLLGVQPESVSPGAGLSPAVRETSKSLATLLGAIIAARTVAPPQTAIPC